MTDTAASATPVPERTSVVVVGGGYAGLAAALTLQDEGADVVLLEASERIGGRSYSAMLADGTVADHGGQWVGPTQRHLLDLAARFGVETFPTHTAGANIELWHDGTVRHFKISGPEGGPGMEEYERATARIDALAHTVDLEDPSRTPNAEILDSETTHSYFNRTVADPDARERLALAIQGVWTVEPRDISVLHMLFYVASAGGFEQLMEAEGCAQDSRFVGGAQEAAIRVAEHLADRVFLNAEVHRIAHTDHEVTLSTSRGDIVAERVVFALPPSSAVRVRFDPALPASRAKWWAKSPMGDVAKIHVTYPEPFWRERGLSGEASVYGDPAVGVVFDNSPADASTGVLVCFVYADRLRAWAALGDNERRGEVVGLLVRLFGDDAADPDHYVEKNWTEDLFAGGGYAANPTPGTWIEHGTQGWRQPVGRLHWAGAETASEWNGYMDGAISSGYRAAREVLRSL